MRLCTDQIGLGVGRTGLWQKGLVVGVVGGEWCLFVLDVILLDHRGLSLSWGRGGFRWAVLPLSTFGCFLKMIVVFLRLL